MDNTTFKALDWSRSSNIYEINLRQYTEEGTFNAFAKHLPRLKDMGVEILWFMPITPIATEKRLGTLGSYYACSDYISINPEYGNLSDFKNFVTFAHTMGFKVIIDWVANHTGYGHTWTKSNPEYYKKNVEGTWFDEHGWEDVIDLDYTNMEMRKTMLEAMHFWVDECKIDGYRCDMAHLVPIDFWVEARTSLDAKKPLFWLAECEEPYYHNAFDATYSWKLLHKMEAYWKHQTDITGLDSVLVFYGQAFAKDAIKLFFTSNHDENSHSGSEYERMGDGAKAFAILTCTWNAMPLVYCGQEAAVTKRIKFFEKDAIEWNNSFPLHDFYKTLLQLRRNNPALRAGDELATAYRISTDNDGRLFGYLRKNGANEVVVLLNLSPDAYWANLTDSRVEGTFVNAFTKEENDITANRYFEMEPWGYYVYAK